ncbi:MAG: hypothetical protein QW728_03785 [Thermoplasmata archaeon]
MPYYLSGYYANIKSPLRKFSLFQTASLILTLLIIPRVSATLTSSAIPLDPYSECIPVYRVTVSGYNLNLSSTNYTYTLGPSGDADVRASFVFYNPQDVELNATILYPFFEKPTGIRVYINSSICQSIWSSKVFNRTFPALIGKKINLLQFNFLIEGKQQKEVVVEYTRKFVIYDNPDEWGKIYYRLTLETSTLNYSDTDGYKGLNSTVFTATFLVNEEIFSSTISTSSYIETGGKVFVNGEAHNILILSKRVFDSRNSCDLAFMSQRSLWNILKTLFLYSKYRYYIWAFLIITVLWAVSVRIYRRAKENRKRRKMEYIRDMKDERGSSTSRSTSNTSSKNTNDNVNPNKSSADKKYYADYTRVPGHARRPPT